MEGARRRLLRRPRVRHRRPSRARCTRSGPTSSTPGPSPRAPGVWPTTSPRPRGPTRPRSCAIARDTRHNSPEFAQVVRPGPGRGRLQGLPLPRLPLDPPALLRRPLPEVRLRDHDHRLAQRPVGQRLQVLLRDRRPGDPARRLGDHRLRQGSLRPRDPREGLRRGHQGRLDRPGRPRGRRGLHLGRRRASPSATPATSRSSTRRCTASARPRWPRRSSRRDSPRSTSSPRSAPPTATSRTSPATSRTPRSPRPSTPPSPRPRPPAPTSSSPATPTPTGSASACPSPATPRASGPPSTATRSAPCSPPSS